jgi:hypothetical protein
MSDKDKLLEWFRSGRTITPVEAMNELGCYRLGARIFDLRKDGHTIVTTMETTTDRHGERCRFARYKLVE